jgi:hypothetical protein
LEASMMISASSAAIEPEMLGSCRLSGCIRVEDRQRLDSSMWLYE